MEFEPTQITHISQHPSLKNRKTVNKIDRFQ